MAGLSLLGGLVVLVRLRWLENLVVGLFVGSLGFLGTTD